MKSVSEPPMPVQLPEFIELETSKLCNRTCSWCPNGGGIDRSDQELMDWALFSSIIRQLGECGYNGWLALHNYNEPLLNPRLAAEVQYISEIVPNAKTFIFTNGDYLTQANIEQLCASGVSEIRVTLYPRASSSSQLTGPSESRIKKWLKAKCIGGYEWDYQRIRQGLAASAAHGKAILRIISPDMSTYNYRGGSALVQIAHVRTVRCTRTSHSAAIDYAGRFKMCCNVVAERADHAPYIIGSLLQFTFVQLWESARMVQLRVAHEAADWSLSSVCSGCSHIHPNDIGSVAGFNDPYQTQDQGAQP